MIESSPAALVEIPAGELTAAHIGRGPIPMMAHRKDHVLLWLVEEPDDA